MREKYVVRPLEHILDLGHPTINSDALMANWPSINVMLDQNRVKRRWSYTTYKTLVSTEKVLAAAIFNTETSQYSVALTENDLINIETGSGHTYSYKTETSTTGHISNITTTAVTGDGTNWADGDAIAAGDKFILDADHTADEEPDSAWATVASVTDDTHLTLSVAYTGTTGAFDPVKDYKIRKVLASPPSKERYNYAVVDNFFCFTNRNINVQKWSGSGYTSDLNSTSATNAKFCISYANRLLLADVVVSETRKPWRLMWSKEGDPENWTDTTAGSNDFIGTESGITGLGVVGAYLFVYKEDGYHIGQRTGVSTSPILFPMDKKGIGVRAPYSLLHFQGTNAFLGRDDFYAINGDTAESIGEKIRYKFFNMVDEAELENVWGNHDTEHKELQWFANTTEGQFAFVFNYKTKEWQTYQFAHEITGMGEGL